MLNESFSGTVSNLLYVYAIILPLLQGLISDILFRQCPSRQRSLASCVHAVRVRVVIVEMLSIGAVDLRGLITLLAITVRED